MSTSVPVGRARPARSVDAGLPGDERSLSVNMPVSRMRRIDDTPHGGKWGLIATYAALTLVGIVMVFPFLWMIATSFKQPNDIYTLSLLPSRPTLDNYVTALTRFPFARWFSNSLLV